MLIFLYGADTLRLGRKMKQIVSEYKNRSKGSDFAVFDAEDISAHDFFRAFFQPSLFAAKKFFIVKNPIASKEFKEAIIGRIGEISASPNNILFCQKGKVLKADRFLKALSKAGQVQEFIPLGGADLEQWIAAELAALGRPESAGIAPLLARRLGNDLWLVANEIRKLVNFAAGRKITSADIEKNISAVFENNIFQTVDALAGQNKKEAIAMIRRHIARGDHPLYLLAMIAGQFKNLLLVKNFSAAGARRLGMHPYVFAKTVAQARRFEAARLKKDYFLIRQADFDIKTGKIDALAGLDLLVAAL
jgi:DNA polymerase-3 subunit delta